MAAKQHKNWLSHIGLSLASCSTISRIFLLGGLSWRPRNLAAGFENRKWIPPYWMGIIGPQLENPPMLWINWTGWGHSWGEMERKDWRIWFSASYKQRISIISCQFTRSFWTQFPVDAYWKDYAEASVEKESRLESAQWLHCNAFHKNSRKVPCEMGA